MSDRIEPSRAKGPAAIRVFGIIRLMEFRSGGTAPGVPCLEVKLAIYDPASTAGSMMAHTVPLPELRQLGSDHAFRDSAAEHGDAAVTDALQGFTSLGCSQFQKAYGELVVNVESMAAMLRKLGLSVEAPGGVLVESLLGDDNFPITVASEADLDPVGRALFAPDMVRRWIGREIAWAQETG
ncbi:hypothetical protein [uncultured Jannaschia sp.]|uniref:hypothetical protein n=1 Tax=uncultured Jannaschia sp. TaxID=293347 RepID=UPI00260954E0|nr:hypothetical protein [uncultured Jannaschia sp.]